MKKIGYLLGTDPHTDRVAWSGIHYQTCKAIEQAGYEVVWIPVRNYLIIRFFNVIVHCFVKALSLWKTGIDKHFLLWNYPIINRKQVAAVDYLFTGYPPDFVPSLLKTTKPIILGMDATFTQVMAIYLPYRRKNKQRPKFNMRHGYLITKKAHDKALKVICSSAWHADSVLNEYKTDKNKVHIVPFGANIDEKNIAVNTDKKVGGVVDALFIGVNWLRKGGDMAIEICRELIKQGINVRLHIVGCYPPPPQTSSCRLSTICNFLW